MQGLSVEAALDNLPRPWIEHPGQEWAERVARKGSITAPAKGSIGVILSPFVFRLVLVGVCLISICGIWKLTELAGWAFGSFGVWLDRIGS